MLNILAVVLVLGGLIFFHELGHFVFARIFRVGVQVFSLGFGPGLASFKRGNTEYRLSAFPLGGYVSMVGERPGEELPEGFPENSGFMSKPAWQRMIIVAAGPFFNFFLAFLIYWFLFVAHGQIELLPVVGEVYPDTPAQAAGLEHGDRILSIDGHDVTHWAELSETIRESGEISHELTIERGGRAIELTITPKIMTQKNIFGEEIRIPLIGIVASGETMTVDLTAGSAFTEAAAKTWQVVALTVTGIIKLVERIVPLETVGGPIMIVQQVMEQAEHGLVNVLALTALISVNLGLINLLPIPVLDGGHILFFGIEAVARRPISPRWQAMAMRLGITLLIMIMVLAVYNDIHRILTTSS